MFLLFLRKENMTYQTWAASIQSLANNVSPKADKVIAGESPKNRFATIIAAVSCHFSKIIGETSFDGITSTNPGVIGVAALEIGLLIL